MQQHALVAGAQAEKGCNLVRGQAVESRRATTMCCRSGSSAKPFSSWLRVSAIMISSSGEPGQGRSLPSSV
jgi:hypothetical protein